MSGGASPMEVDALTYQKGKGKQKKGKGDGAKSKGKGTKGRSLVLRVHRLDLKVPV